MQRREDTILRGAEEAIADLGLGWQILRRKPQVGRQCVDAIARLRYPEGEVDLAVAVKARPTLQRADLLLPPEHGSMPGLVVADYVNPNLADRLRELGVNFIDAAGNAHLRHKGLFVWVTGKRDKLRIEAERERRRAFQPSGLKLLFALLCRPELAETDYRTLADTAGIALGTVQWAMRDLVNEGYVLRLGRFERRLVQPKELLDAWAPAYARDLRARVLLGRFEATDLNWWTGTDLRPYRGQWGGEPAAARLTGHLKPGGLTIYADEIPPRLILERRLEKNEAGRIDFRRRFWRFDADAEPTETVPPVLVYADLLALNEPRARETAAHLYEKILDGPFRAHLARWAR